MILNNPNTSLIRKDQLNVSFMKAMIERDVEERRSQRQEKATIERDIEERSQRQEALIMQQKRGVTALPEDQVALLSHTSSLQGQKNSEVSGKISEISENENVLPPIDESEFQGEELQPGAETKSNGSLGQSNERKFKSVTFGQSSELSDANTSSVVLDVAELKLKSLDKTFRLTDPMGNSKDVSRALAPQTQPQTQTQTQTHLTKVVPGQGQEQRPEQGHGGSAAAASGVNHGGESLAGVGDVQSVSGGAHATTVQRTAGSLVRMAYDKATRVKSRPHSQPVSSEHAQQPGAATPAVSTPQQQQRQQQPLLNISPQQPQQHTKQQHHASAHNHLPAMFRHYVGDSSESEEEQHVVVSVGASLLQGHGDTAQTVLERLNNSGKMSDATSPNSQYSPHHMHFSPRGFSP